MNDEVSEPCYVISIAARMVGLETHTLRYYERLGLLEPCRSQGNRRLYSARDLERLRQIKTLMDELGVNLAGVEVILRLRERITEMAQHLQEMEALVQRLTGTSLLPQRGESYDETR